MPVPAIISDGQMQSGSVSVTINGVSYIISNFTVTRPKTDADDENAVGSPQRRRTTHGRSTYTAELQLATGSTARPIFGQTFTLTVDAAYGAETWVIDPVGFEMTNQPGDIRTASISGWKVITGITTTGTNVG